MKNKEEPIKEVIAAWLENENRLYEEIKASRHPDDGGDKDHEAYLRRRVKEKFLEDEALIYKKIFGGENPAPGYEEPFGEGRYENERMARKDAFNYAGAGTPWVAAEERYQDLLKKLKSDEVFSHQYVFEIQGGQRITCLRPDCNKKHPKHKGKINLWNKWDDGFYHCRNCSAEFDPRRRTCFTETKKTFLTVMEIVNAFDQHPPISKVSDLVKLVDIDSKTATSYIKLVAPRRSQFLTSVCARKTSFAKKSLDSNLRIRAWHQFIFDQHPWYHE